MSRSVPIKDVIVLQKSIPNGRRYTLPANFKRMFVITKYVYKILLIFLEI